MVGPPSDDDLLRRAPSDAASFGTFYERHERKVLAYFARRTGDAELAADLTAETFAAALIAATRYRAGERPAIAWLFGIARHMLLRSLERGRIEDRARRRLGMPVLALEDDQIERIERLGGAPEAMAWLESLPPDQAAAIREHVIEERSYNDIAARLRCSEAMVRKRVSRGLASLRASMRNET